MHTNSNEKPPVTNYRLEDCLPGEYARYPLQVYPRSNRAWCLSADFQLPQMIEGVIEFAVEAIHRLYCGEARPFRALLRPAVIRG